MSFIGWGPEYIDPSLSYFERERVLSLFMYTSGMDGFDCCVNLSFRTMAALWPSCGSIIWGWVMHAFSFFCVLFCDAVVVVGGGGGAMVTISCRKHERRRRSTDFAWLMV